MAGTRYRGRRGSGKPLVIGLLAIAALVAAGLFVGYSLLQRNEESKLEAVARAALATSKPEPLPMRTPEPSAPMLPEPPEVRGIYISGPIAGDPYMDKLIELIDETELNAVVIDIKDDEGHVTYRPESGMAVELDACVRYIRDLPALMAKLKEHGIYTIARIAAFKDPVLAEKRPELALCREDGTPVSESGGLFWVNPYEREGWDYLSEIALSAADMGFDEVQFDYVRFPTVKNMDALDYGPAAEGVSREDVIVTFLETMTEALHAKGVLVSADVFGTVITSKRDGSIIGQSYPRMAAAVDYLCPMVYPSHYVAGSFGIDVPDAAPYETVLRAMEGSRTALSEVPEDGRAGVRVWLQDFTATWVKGHIPYGAEELRAQIQAVYDAGYTDWILWNAKNTYASDGLLKAETAPS